MRMIVKAVMRLVIVTTLFMMTGCGEQQNNKDGTPAQDKSALAEHSEPAQISLEEYDKYWSEVYSNEVLCAILGINTGTSFDGSWIAVIENSSITDGLHVHNVISCCRNVLQAYRIEKRSIINYRHLEDSRPVMDEAKELLSMMIHKQRDPDSFDESRKRYHAALTEKLSSQVSTVVTGDVQNGLLEEGQKVRYVGAGYAFAHSLFRKEEAEWHTGEVPFAVEVFYQIGMRETSQPRHKKNYPSFMRALPLFTEEDLKAEKDKPVLDWNKVRYHVRFAVAYPYALIPVPEKESPFPEVKEYVPGDTFRVKNMDRVKGEPPYYLIETFKGCETESAL